MSSNFLRFCAIPRDSTQFCEILLKPVNYLYIKLFQEQAPGQKWLMNIEQNGIETAFDLENIPFANS